MNKINKKMENANCLGSNDASAVMSLHQMVGIMMINADITIQSRFSLKNVFMLNFFCKGNFISNISSTI